VLATNLWARCGQTPPFETARRPTWKTPPPAPQRKPDPGARCLSRSRGVVPAAAPVHPRPARSRHRPVVPRRRAVILNIAEAYPMPGADRARRFRIGRGRSRRVPRWPRSTGDPGRTERPAAVRIARVARPHTSHALAIGAGREVIAVDGRRTRRRPLGNKATSHSDEIPGEEPRLVSPAAGISRISAKPAFQIFAFPD